MRINGFEQIKGFYSWVFENQDKNIRTTHISLYMFLINQNNRNNWIEWFKCPFDLAMSGSGITNKNTYYKTLNDLQDWGIIEYKKGVNNYKAPLIKIEVLFDTSTVPQSEPLLQPQVIPLPLPLLQPQLAKNIKLLTSNIKLITVNVDKVLSFLKSESVIEDQKDILFVPESGVLYNVDDLKNNYLNSKVFEAVLNNKNLKLKNKEDLEKRLERFTEDLKQKGRFSEKWNEYTSYFLNCLKKDMFKNVEKNDRHDKIIF